MMGGRILVIFLGGGAISDAFSPDTSFLSLDLRGVSEASPKRSFFDLLRLESLSLGFEETCEASGSASAACSSSIKVRLCFFRFSFVAATAGSGD